MNTRRDLLKFAGGSALGILFTPAPWRLITDTALWSENWPGIPKPARGEIRAKFTNCSLCPSGCAVRARCVGEQPVSLAGVRGGLCPFGITGHHLPNHPARLRQGMATEAAAAVAGAIKSCGPAERVAVLDLRPGRTASWTYRRTMAAIGGLYLAPADATVSVDLAQARTVLSLSAPVLDGWASPANAFAARDRFRLIQAEAVESRTAAMADVWLPIRPGSEEALALGLNGALTAPQVAAATGLTEQQIASLATELSAGGPSLVVDRGMSAAVMALNLKLGAWGRTVGPRREAPVPQEWKKAAPRTDLSAVADRSIRVLLIDESTPGQYVAWDEIEKKLVAENPVVVVLSPSPDGLGRYAKYVLPTAVYPESVEDIPAPVDSMTAGFRISTPLVAAIAGVTSPSEFVGTLAGLPAADSLRARADAIHAAGRGTLFTYADSKSAPLRGLTADDFWKALNAGGAWVGEPETVGPAPKIDAKATRPIPTGDRPVMLAEAHSALLVSPLLSKVYQESDLLLAPDCIAMHPADARAAGLGSGHAVIETARGKAAVRVLTDTSVRPGVVLAGRPDLAGAHGKVVPS